MLPSYHPKRFEHIMADVVFGRWAGQLRHLMRCSCASKLVVVQDSLSVLYQGKQLTPLALLLVTPYRVCIFRDVFPFFGWRWFCEPVCAYSHAAHRVSESESPVGPAECAHLSLASRGDSREPRVVVGARGARGQAGEADLHNDLLALRRTRVGNEAYTKSVCC